MNIGYLVELEINIMDPPYDGPANHVRHVIAELARRGHRLRLIFRQRGSIWQTDDLITFTPVEVPEMDGGPRRWTERGVRRVQSELGAPYIGFFESARFAYACRRQLADVDVLFERKSWMTYGGALAARWMGIPLVLEDNGDSLTDLEAKGMAPTGLHLRVSKAVMRRAIHAAAHIVATGDGWRDKCIERWGVDPDRVTTIENGTSLVDMLSRNDLRSFEPAPAGGTGITFVYVGGFLPWHGVDILLRAAAQVQQKVESVRVDLIGSGPGFAEARDFVQSLSLADVVTFHGQLPTSDYAPILARADVGLSPYCNWPEYSGLKILDYKAAGLPTITSGQGDRPRTVVPGSTGLIVPPCDERALVDAMFRLAFDPATRREMGRTARIHAEQSHRWSDTVANLEAVFGDVLSRTTVHRTDAAPSVQDMTL